MKDFKYWKNKFENNDLQEFSINKSALLWLKIKSILRNEILSNFLVVNSIQLTTKTLQNQFVELFEILSKNIEDSNSILDSFIREKNQEQKEKLDFVACPFVSKDRTSDYVTTYRLREMLKDGAREYDIAAYLKDMYMATDDITMTQLTEMIIENPPSQGFIAVSTALQWRFHYSRVFKSTDSIDGIQKII